MPETNQLIQPVSVKMEWKRIEILALCLVESNANREPSATLLNDLQQTQTQVHVLRAQKQWEEVSLDGLSELAIDILACVYATEIHPRVFLLFQELQPNGQYHPSLAFLYLLLALSDEAYHEAKMLVSAEGKLTQQNLLLTEGDGNLMQLKPHPAVLAKLGEIKQDLQIPGAVLVKLDNDWNELVLSDKQDRVLHEFLLWIKHHDTVVNQWGARESGGPIALFSGPSGTGKTFVASALANKLGWALYKVDLGALISKYLGETEKNLNKLFDAAHQQNIVLQFDEVDALMGKRGEVKDARDRYANMEVSHLLSRIELHQGPCILTTNLGNNIDSAFTRRFHFVIEFSRPDAKERERLWNILIPKGAPKSSYIDSKLLAESVNLTGGEIRNAALHAAVLAAAEKDSNKNGINMQHLSIGVLRVLQKQDWYISSSRLRQLAIFLPAAEQEEQEGDAS